MTDYPTLAALPLHVESATLAGLRAGVTSGFERHTTVVSLHGKGCEGRGEDVTYETDEQRRFQNEGLPRELIGRWTFGAFSDRLDDVDLFSHPPRQPSSRLYRRWAVESAALDLALCQAGRSLAELLGREPRRLRFVVSLRLGNPPTAEPVERWLEYDPTLRFKLDAVSTWTDELCERLAASGAVESVDFKGAYRGTIVDQPADVELYRRVIRSLPDAWLEDPAWTEQTRAVLGGQEHRVTWDAPIHTTDDVESLPARPRSLNIKPSRSGRLRDLFELYAHCRARGIACYGGGQFELGPGRGQAQLLAALFHADGPNDLAPREFNVGTPRAGLPRSPLALRPLTAGFGVEGDRAERDDGDGRTR